MNLLELPTLIDVLQIRKTAASVNVDASGDQDALPQPCMRDAAHHLEIRRCAEDLLEFRSNRCIRTKVLQNLAQRG